MIPCLKPLTTAALIRARDIHCETCGRQEAPGNIFLWVLWFPSANIIPTKVHTILHLKRYS